jgi:MYXO-CTERM domain-containing protein
MMWKQCLNLLLGAAMLLPGAAWAGVHVIKIVEIFHGSPANPNAQYVVLQMYSGGQIFTNGTDVRVSDNNNVEVGVATFTANLPNQAPNNQNQAKILIATAEAATLFGVTPDLVMPSAFIPVAGGKVCFDANGFGIIDCVAWGNHPGSAAGGAATNVGTPFRTQGLIPGKAIARRLNIAGGANNLDGGDDTNNSATDFVLATPAPRNSSAQNGTIPSATCGNNTTEGIEGCDDNNVAAGDGCDAACNVEFCGDAIDNNTTEQCDDGNAVNTDACKNDCTLPACGDNLLSLGEECDDGNILAGDGCDATCFIEDPPALCGNGTLDAGDGEECDDTNTTNGDGCSSFCLIEECGDGFVNNNNTEACDDGNLINEDGCSAACVVENCGDGVVQSGLAEECDDANQVNDDACTNGCLLGFCGDGIQSAALNEQCDDGNETSEDGCDAGCFLESCGDGVVQADPNRPEDCDDTNDINTDACLNDCTNASCGDGFIQSGVEACDDGNLTNGDGCESNCTIVVTLPPLVDDGGICAVNAASGDSRLASLFGLFGLFAMTALFLRRRS